VTNELSPNAHLYHSFTLSDDVTCLLLAGLHCILMTQLDSVNILCSLHGSLVEHWTCDH